MTIFSVSFMKTIQRIRVMSDKIGDSGRNKKVNLGRKHPQGSG